MEAPQKVKNRGILGGSVIKHLPSTQVTILGSWDQVPRLAPCLAGCLLLPLPLPLLVFPLPAAQGAQSGA